MTGASDLLRIDISQEAYNALHSRFLSEKSDDKDTSKSSVAVKLITLGLNRSSNMEPSRNPRRTPVPGQKVVQIKKSENTAFLLKLDKFTEEKRFYSRAFAARYCLYLILELDTDD